MKKIYFTLLISLCSHFAMCQTVNGIPLKEIDAEYVRIVGTQKLFGGSQVSIDIEFGQRDRLFSTKDTQIRDENNKPVILNSMIDALNFMDRYGYYFLTAYAINNGNNQTIYHYLMRRDPPQYIQEEEKP